MRGEFEQLRLAFGALSILMAMLRAFGISASGAKPLNAPARNCASGSGTITISGRRLAAETTKSIEGEGPMRPRHICDVVDALKRAVDNVLGRKAFSSDR
jgi:hypothetical protein